MRYVDSHLAHHLDSATLARLLVLSRSQFIRLFKRSLGLTPREYVMHRRTVRAEELLVTTDLKLTVVAERCGFSDDTHMARWLRRVLDMRPGELRRNAAKNALTRSS
jgi:AraC family transcriptional regulator